MSSPAVTVPESLSAGEVAKLMMERDIGAVVVVDHAGRMKGLITESDFTGVARCVPFTLELAPVIFGARAASLRELESIYAQVKNLPASRIMSEEVATCHEDDDLGTVVHTMLQRKLKHIPVVRGEKIVGMMARHDVLKLLATSSPA